MAKQNTSILAVIRYHVWWPSSLDPFYQENTAAVVSRVSYYGISSTPAGRLDGKDTPFTNSSVSSRASVDSPLSIELWNSYNDTTRQGTITAKIKNTSASTTVSGKIQFALCETGIHFTASNGVGIHNQTMLDMLPSAAGEAITLASGDSLEKTHDYTIIDSLPLNPPQKTKYHVVLPESCQIVVFVQNSSTHDVYQAQNLWVTSTQGMKLKFDKSSVNGGNDQLNPGQTGNLVLTVTNSGDKPLNDVQGTLTTTDSYLTVTKPVGNFGTIPPDQSKDNQSEPFVVTADPSTPNGHTVNFTLTVRTSNNYETDIPFSLSVTGVGEVSRPTPARVELGSAQPNPMHDRTVISYGLPRSMVITLKLYSASGALVKTLVAGTEPAGTRQILWDGTDAQGKPVASGVYFYELVAQGPKATERITKKFMAVR